YGASPRASIGLVRAGRAMALLRGRDYVIPQDVFDVAPEIFRHRLVLTYEALAAEVDAEAILIRLLSTVPAPAVQPTQQPATQQPPTQQPAAHQPPAPGSPHPELSQVPVPSPSQSASTYPVPPPFQQG
ncbi:MAG: MoxR family ATPase, partial [Actinobacteria bacterium]|nr:MoxR family ATPase [Actinomycetota bacterium]